MVGHVVLYFLNFGAYSKTIEYIRAEMDHFAAVGKNEILTYCVHGVCAAKKIGICVRRR